MCGICGFYTRGNKMDSSQLVSATESLSHRGPDGLGMWVDGSRVAGLGHTRLAILDLESGHQPMRSDDDRFIIVFNGEIYNFAELKRDLELSGYSFKTRSDTEVLLNAYRKWGRESLRKLDGMFAFAIYDSEHR